MNYLIVNNKVFYLAKRKRQKENNVLNCPAVVPTNTPNNNNNKSTTTTKVAGTIYPSGQWNYEMGQWCKAEQTTNPLPFLSISVSDDNWLFKLFTVSALVAFLSLSTKLNFVRCLRLRELNCCLFLSLKLPPSNRNSALQTGM